jgi:hypothetical protein
VPRELEPAEREDLHEVACSGIFRYTTRPVSGADAADGF